MKKAKAARAVTFKNGMGNPTPGFVITCISEQDVRDLNAGKIPAWIADTVRFWCRDNPTPTDTQDQFERSELEMMRRALADGQKKLEALQQEHRRALAYSITGNQT